ncbi:hypothetical protein [Aureispira anguillae]|uniref:HTTM domain-containing protein n=1 Tax=Aureispira anguillae TaxID=2864201 RepID=A0A915YDN6_9BACT|nr:hypothetical protein [Aureispira anguillae]BDS11145.1 hypothetical protein AsAng_0018560 [Aureispira anguillae]
MPTKDKQTIQRIIWLFLLFVWLLRFKQGLLLHQLHLSPFISPKADNIYWIYHALQLPHCIIQHFYLGLLLDLLWFFSCLWGIKRSSSRSLGIIILFLVVNYSIIYNSVATHHEHKLVGLLFCLPLLILQSPKNFVLAFAGIRYYAIFALFSAGLWKIWRGSIFFPNQMSEILKHQHLDYLINYPNSHFSTFISYLIDHPYCSSAFWYGGWILELSFIVGFITRKFDKLLGVLFLIFFLMDYLLMHLCFIEFCIFALLFYPWKGIWNYYETKLV